MTTYSNWDQRMLDQQFDAEMEKMERAAKRKLAKKARDDQFSELLKLAEENLNKMFPDPDRAYEDLEERRRLDREHPLLSDDY